MTENLTHPKRISQNRPKRWQRQAALILSALLCIAVSVCYGFRPDALAAVTVFPVWIWLGLGLPLTGLGYSRTTKRPFVVVAFLWLLYFIIFAEEPKSLLRFQRIPTHQWQLARAQGKGLRVVSLNCRGSEEAVAEIAQVQPDIVLLQEGLGGEETQRVARFLFREKAGILWNGDTAILVRGTIQPVPHPRALRETCVHGHVRLISGLETDVVSVHLMPNIVRTDLWSPDCWRAHKANRQARREQLRVIVRHLKTVPANRPLIVGGDFNAPAGDAVFRLLPSHLHDAFREGGIGWGNTFHNDFPILRIDQIWVSKHFWAVAVFALKTLHSDHRMVACDLVVR